MHRNSTHIFVSLPYQKIVLELGIQATLCPQFDPVDHYLLPILVASMCINFLLHASNVTTFIQRAYPLVPLKLLSFCTRRMIAEAIAPFLLLD